MTESEVNRAVQYVTASTSYGRETVAEVIRTGLAELTALAATSSLQAGRETILAFVCQWTIKRTGYPEPLVWEVLGYAGRWLDEMYEDTIARDQPDLLRESDC
jgi:hypothetical protein